MRDVPPCVIPETKHWRNTPPRSQQCVRRIQQYGRREKTMHIITYFLMNTTHHFIQQVEEKTS
jgi:hypothetical protein